MYGCESWTIKKAECQRIRCFWTVMLEKTLDSPLDSKEIKPVNPKGNQPWIFLGRKVMTNLDSILKSRDVTLPTKVHLVKAMVFSNSHVWMWELDYKESLVPKNWCFWTVVLEKTLESPLDCKEIIPANLKGNQPWIFIGRLMLKLTLQYFDHQCKEVTYWKRLWCWERWKEKGEGGSRGWDI